MLTTTVSNLLGAIMTRCMSGRRREKPTQGARQGEASGADRGANRGESHPMGFLWPLERRDINI
jgi:hypothetical protein